MKILLLFLGILLGCDMRERHHDASAEPRSRDALGARYVVVGPLDAYGVRQDPQAPVDHVTLAPPPGVDDPEVDFRMPVPMGATITVRKVMRTNRLFDPEMTFIVALEGAALPVTAPVRIDLFRGNEGRGRLQLNPAIYRRLPAP